MKISLYNYINIKKYNLAVFVCLGDEGLKKVYKVVDFYLSDILNFYIN